MLVTSGTNRCRSSWVRAGLSVGLVLAAVLQAFGTAAAEQIYTAEEIMARSFPAGPGRIEVHMFNGSIEVAGGGSSSLELTVVKRGSGYSQAEAQADLKAIAVDFKTAGSALVVEAKRTDDRHDRPNSGASARLQVPSGLQLVLISSNGNVTVRGPARSVKAETSNAGITVTGVKTVQELTTCNGSITVQQGAGRLVLATSNGGIEVQAGPATVSAETSNGPIAFNGELAKGKHTLSTSNDGIDLVLPAGSAFLLDAETSNAGITCELPITATDRSEEVLKGQVGTKTGATVVLRSSNGDIKVRRR